MGRLFGKEEILQILWIPDYFGFSTALVDPRSKLVTKKLMEFSIWWPSLVSTSPNFDNLILNQLKLLDCLQGLSQTEHIAVV